MALSEIQSLWEVPAVTHFFQVFQKALSSQSFDVEDLEENLLCSNNSKNTFLDDLVMCLLDGYFHYNINYDNLAENLTKALNSWCEREEYKNPLEEKSFIDLSAKSKAQLLFILCHLWLDCHDITDIALYVDLNIINAVNIGTDQHKANYLFFHGTRLYKETSDSVKSKKRLGKKNRSSSPAVENEKIYFISTDSTKNSWQLVCKVEQDWIQLADKMSNSRFKNEQILGSNINKFYISSVKQAFEIKEKELRRKLLEMCAKRESKRIAVKRQTEDELRVKELVEIEKQRKIEDAMKEKHKKMKEQEETVRKANEREQRILDRQKALEERAIRATLREENSALISSKCNLEENNLHVINSVNNNKMQKLIKDLMIQDDSWIFLDPIDEEFAPQYFSVIQNPICLKDMEEKLDKGSYSNFKSMEKDFSLLISNCYTYNGLKSECSKMANGLFKAFRNSCKKYRLPVSLSLTAIAQNLKINKVEVYQQDENSIDLPMDEDNLNNININNDENLMNSGFSSHSSSDFDVSSSDYDDFETIIKKKPRLKSQSNHNNLVASDRVPGTSLKDIENDYQNNMSKKSMPTWSYRCMVDSNDNTSASLVKLNNIPKVSPIKIKAVMKQTVSAKLDEDVVDNKQSDNVKKSPKKVGLSINNSGSFCTYGVQAIRQNENGVMELKIVKKTT